MNHQRFLAALVLGCSAGASVQAASIYLTPPVQMVGPGATTATFELMMDFALSELTVGGGIDIDVVGAASFGSFAPSTYFLTVADPAFSGFGTLRADADYEIHFGSFGGLSGLNHLGTITLQVAQPFVAGSASVALATNSFWGGFYSATTGSALPVTLTGATLIPEPQAALLLLAGLGVVGAVAGRRARRA